MPTKVAPSPALSSPPLGTLIADGSLELVEVLGVGGYGVVYRAETTQSPFPESYAVKCLVPLSTQKASRQRALHIREITLHRLASFNPNVVALHRVIEENERTYIIMEYASDGDLFSQILHSCRYLGKNHLIKHVFLQLVDAVEYCHSIGIYHRDLKPENVLCFDGGLRVALTDFGLATTDRLSDEFRTGSVYHMSPECFGGEMAPMGNYSPLANDIWSLAVILINLATGRNPWKSASLSDPTFQAYLENPRGFLPTVLPLSLEVNSILVRMLNPDWRERIPLAEVRIAIEDVENFYSEAVIFEGSMARCPWEAGMDIESASDVSAKEEADLSTAAATTADAEQDGLRSCWSQDTQSEMVFATSSMVEGSSASWDEGYSTGGPSWGFDTFDSPSEHANGLSFKELDPPATPPSTYSPLSPSGSSSSPSTPVTSEYAESFDGVSQIFTAKSLTLNTGRAHYRYGNGSAETLSTDSCTMHTAVSANATWSSSFVLPPSTLPSKASSPVDMDCAVMDFSVIGFADTSAQAQAAYSPQSEIQVAMPDVDMTAVIPPPMPAEGDRWLAPHLDSPPSPPASPPPKRVDARRATSGLFSPAKFIFPRPGRQRFDSAPMPPPAMPLPEPPLAAAKFELAGPPKDSRAARTKRHWFSPGKLFAGASTVM